MALKMVLFWVSTILSIIGINAAGEFAIVHSPNSLRFSGNNKLLESSLKEVYSASLGLSVAENSQWDGLNIADPFNTPEAIVEVYIDGVESLGNPALKPKTYPLLIDEYEPETYEAMKHRITQRFNNGRNKFVDIKTSSPEKLAAYTQLFGDLSAIKPTKEIYSHLKFDTEEDAQFMRDIKILKTITAKVNANALNTDNDMDFFYFRISSLHALSDYHGPNSLQLKEAKKVLADALDSLSRAFSKAYEGSVLFAIVTTDVAHTRRTIRAAPQLEKSGSIKVRARKVRPLREKSTQTTTQKSTQKSAQKSTQKSTQKPQKVAKSKGKKGRQGGEAGDGNSDPNDTEDPDTVGDRPIDDPRDISGGSISGGEGADASAIGDIGTVVATASSDGYQGDYAAIFNIIFWYVVVFVFALLTIVYALADMDPGRDSVIYRMTTIRLKKDN